MNHDGDGIDDGHLGGHDDGYHDDNDGPLTIGAFLPAIHHDRGQCDGYGDDHDDGHLGGHDDGYDEGYNDS